MTGETLLQRTLTLLGYTDHTGEVDTAQVGEIYRGAVHMINLLGCFFSRSVSLV